MKPAQELSRNWLYQPPADIEAEKRRRGEPEKYARGVVLTGAGKRPYKNGLEGGQRQRPDMLAINRCVAILKHAVISRMLKRRLRRGDLLEFYVHVYKRPRTTGGLP